MADFSIPTGNGHNRTTRTTIRRPDGRPVGTVCAGTYRRRLRPEHVLRYPVPSVAVDVAVLDQAEAAGAVVMAFELPDGSTVVLALDAFRAAARTIDRGHGPQLAVPLAAFASTAVQPEPPTAEQLRLFSAVLAGRTR